MKDELSLQLDKFFYESLIKMNNTLEKISDLLLTLLF